MNPKFKLGEPVILQSKDYPHYNGEYVIHAIVVGSELYFDRVLGKLVIDIFPPGEVAYTLCQAFPDPCNPIEIYWDESALRKKQDPSEFSFEELIKELNGEKLNT